MNLYLSDVEIVDCAIQDIEMTTTSFKITSSTFVLTNTVLRNINYSVDADLIFANLDSSIVIDSSNFTDSGSSFLVSRNSNVTIDNLHAENVEYRMAIIQISQSDYIRMEKIRIVNVTINHQRVPIVAISSSNNIQISLLDVENINETILKIASSNIDNMDGLNVKN